MNRICLDTSAYSHFMRNNPQAVEIIVGAHEIGLPAIVLGELQAGFKMGGQVQKNMAELSSFLANSVVTVLEVDQDVAARYSEFVVELRRSGTPLPTNDIWIGAAAAQAGAILITFDKHFEVLRQVGSKILQP